MLEVLLSKQAWLLASLLSASKSDSEFPFHCERGLLSLDSHVFAGSQVPLPDKHNLVNLINIFVSTSDIRD